MAPARWDQVHLHDAQEVLFGVFVQWQVGPGHASVVVGRVEPAEDLDRPRDGRGHGRQIGHVGPDHLGWYAKRPGSGRGFRQAVGVDVHQRHARARGGKGQGAGPADARRGTGDQRGTPGQVSGHGSPHAVGRDFTGTRSSTVVAGQRLPQHRAGPV